MRAVLLVAAREFRQIVSTRGFWVMLLIVPAAFAISIFASILFAPKTTVAFTMVDASGRYGPMVERRLELDYQREVLRGLATYVVRWKLAGVDPAAVWAQPDAWPADVKVARFISEGGSASALRRLQPRLPEGGPEFKPPPRSYVEIAPPAGLPTGQGPEAFGRALATSMQGDVETAAGKRPFVLAIYIPKDFGAPGVVARLWTNGRPIGPLIDTVRGQLTAALRHEALQAAGLSAAAAARIETLGAPIQVTEPPPGAGRGVIVTKSIVPLALVYLLLIAAITTGQMLLQGVIEERSNKLLESVLACIRPAELMHGKLLGLGGVGLAVVAAWVGCAVAAAFLAPGGVVSDLLRPSLAALDQPWMVAALIFYFLCGYLVISMLFLAIGSLSDSMQDAQSYLMPVLLTFMIPVMLMLQVSLRSPDTLFIRVMSWIPLYTPLAMLARLGTGVPLPEMLGTGALLIAFIALELVMLGRLFRASLLSTGQPSRAELFARLMFQSADR